MPPLPRPWPRWAWPNWPGANRTSSQAAGAARGAGPRVLLQPAELLLADEPTASLDDEAAADALALLQTSAAACGASLVIATHDQRVVQALAACRALQRLDLNANPAQHRVEVI